MQYSIFRFLFPLSNSEAMLDKGQKLQTARFRIILIAFAIFMCFFYIVRRIVGLGIDDIYYQDTTSFYSHKKDNVQYRGNLYDRNNVLLASDIVTYELLVNTKNLIQNPYMLAQDLVKIIPDFDSEKFIKYAKKNKGWHLLHARITPAQRKKILTKGLVGLEFKKNISRIYPHKNVASYFTGYISNNEQEAASLSAGLEKALYNDIKNGRDIVTSLDIRMQHILYHNLADTMYHYKAKSAVGLLLKMDTMEVLSMVSLPDFDPNFYTQNKNWLNKATQGGFEPGSTLKLINSAIALESGAVNLKTKYDATKPMRYGKYRINDYHAQNRVLTTPEVFIYSSNIGSAKMALSMTPEFHEQKTLELGLDKKLPILLPEHTAAKAPKNWADIYRITMSYGHGIRVTPLHLVSASAAALGDGHLRAPQFLKQTDTAKQDTIISDKPIFSQNTINNMRRLMRLNVLKGSGRQANIKNMLVGGKTGTSEKAINGGYQKDKIISSFLAVFPAHNPAYLLYVMLDEPQEVEENIRPTGGVAAAPMAANIITELQPFLTNLPLQKDEEAQLDERLHINLPDRKKIQTSY